MTSDKSKKYYTKPELTEFALRPYVLEGYSRRPGQFSRKRTMADASEGAEDEFERNPVWRG